eukprot:11215300-Lingulodinium_polyedra.AAC.1
MGPPRTSRASLARMTPGRTSRTTCAHRWPRLAALDASPTPRRPSGPWWVQLGRPRRRRRGPKTPSGVMRGGRWWEPP